MQPVIVDDTRIDERWADIRPLLDKISDRVTLYGFTPEEAERLLTGLATLTSSQE